MDIINGSGFDFLVSKKYILLGKFDGKYKILAVLFWLVKFILFKVFIVIMSFFLGISWILILFSSFERKFLLLILFGCNGNL